MKNLSSIIVVLFLLFCVNTQAQRPILNDRNLVTSAAVAEIDALLQSTDFITKKNKYFAAMNGAITFDVTLLHTGKVVTFFTVTSDLNHNDFINFVSDFILDHKFSFKLPKNHRHKIRHTVTFNSSNQ